MNAPFLQIGPRIISIASFILFIRLVNVPTAEAQTPVLTRLSSDYALCAVFNPLSNGRIMYSVGQDTFKRSDNAGQSWSTHKLNVNPDYGTIHQALCLPVDTSIILIVDEKEVLRSSDGGGGWQVVLDSGSADGETLDYHQENNTLYFGASLWGPFYTSTDLGVNWQQESSTASKIELCTVSVSPAAVGTILAGAGNGSIARSSDGGVHWDTVYQANTSDFHAEIPKIIYSVHAPQTAYATVFHSHYASFLRTTDDGLTWTSLPADSSYPWALEVDQSAATMVGGVPTSLDRHAYCDSAAPKR